MIFKIREKFWSLGDSFTIFDEQEAPQFFVKGKAFSWGDKLSFQDSSGNELAFIKQRLLSWQPRYEILIDGKPFAEVVKEFSWFKKKFILDVPGPNDYVIDGSFWQHEFEFSRGGSVVAKVSRNLWGWSDSYGVDIVEGEDALSILCTCIVIDQVLDNEKGNGAN